MLTGFLNIDSEFAVLLASMQNSVLCLIENSYFVDYIATFVRV